jgi:hypothetical protein
VVPGVDVPFLVFLGFRLELSDESSDWMTITVIVMHMINPDAIQDGDQITSRRMRRAVHQPSGATSASLQLENGGDFKP